MLNELRESYVNKYESPIAACAHYAALDGLADESTGDSVDWFYHVDRIGKRLVFEDSRGFVTCQRYATEAEARDAFSACEDEFYADDDCEVIEVEGIASGEEIGTCVCGRPLFRSHMAGTIYHATENH